MIDMIKFLALAVIVGGAIPIIIMYLSKKPPHNKN